MEKEGGGWRVLVASWGVTRGEARIGMADGMGWDGILGWELHGGEYI